MTAERTVHHRSFAATTNNYLEPLRAYLRATVGAQRRCQSGTRRRGVHRRCCAAISFTAHGRLVADGRDERLTSFQCSRIELVELLDALDDLTDRRLGGNAVRHL